jgi:hypothetical protein
MAETAQGFDQKIWTFADDIGSLAFGAVRGSR